MAEIFLAESTGPSGFKKKVVLKRILPHLGEEREFRNMFVDEAIIASRFAHPNVVQVFDFDRHENADFIVMEYVDGANLKVLSESLLAADQNWSAAMVAAIGSGVASALSYVHQRRADDGGLMGIVHRDISPHNIMLSRTGAIKLMDFGIAKAADKISQTRTGTLKGKLAYMAPEQANGESLTSATDEYALGLVLWELLCGARAYQAQSEVELLGMVRVGACPRLPDSVPARLQDIVHRMLEPSAQDRFGELASVVEHLDTFRFSLGAEGVVDVSEFVGRYAPTTIDTGLNHGPSTRRLEQPDNDEGSQTSRVDKAQAWTFQTEAIEPEVSVQEPVNAALIFEALDSDAASLDLELSQWPRTESVSHHRSVSTQPSHDLSASAVLPDTSEAAPHDNAAIVSSRDPKASRSPMQIRLARMTERIRLVMRRSTLSLSAIRWQWLVAIVVLVCAGGTSVWAWQYSKISDARNDASLALKSAREPREISVDQTSVAKKVGEPSADIILWAEAEAEAEAGAGDKTEAVPDKEPKSSAFRSKERPLKKRSSRGSTKKKNQGLAFKGRKQSGKLTTGLNIAPKTWLEVNAQSQTLLYEHPTPIQIRVSKSAGSARVPSGSVLRGRAWVDTSKEVAKIYFSELILKGGKRLDTQADATNAYRQIGVPVHRNDETGTWTLKSQQPFRVYFR